jgi:vitamin B12 transporter
MKRFLATTAWRIWLVLAAGSTGILNASTEAGPKAPNQSGEDDKPAYQIVVTANRSETARNEVGSSVTVITAQQIERMQKTTVLDVLRAVPSLDVTQAGGPGGQTSVFIRGAKTEHALILWDGVEINDPSTPGRSLDFAHLTTADIERIEIVRGPQSTLYGSDAMSGVIHIISKTGQGQPRGFISSQYGSLDTCSESASVRGGSRRMDYALSLSRLDTTGISAASENDGNSEPDGYANTTVSAKLGVSPSSRLHTDLMLRYLDSRADLDNAGGVGGDDPNSAADSEQFFFRTQTRLSLLDGRWEQTLAFSLTNLERTYRNDTDADHPLDLERSSYNGQTMRLSWQSDLRLRAGNTLSAGLESEREHGESDYYSESAWGPYAARFPRKTARTASAYIQDHLRLAKSWFLTLGARLDDHDRFGTRATWRVAATGVLPGTGTRLRGTLGTGFKAPSLYQLYSMYGEADLKPETSTGWDIGIEQSMGKGRLTLGITYFRNIFEQLIDYNSATWTYENIGAARTRGIEAFAALRLSGNLTLQADYTFTDTQDDATGLELLRRARHKAGAQVDGQFGKRLHVSLEADYASRRMDMDYGAWPYARVTLNSYLLVDLVATFDLNRHARLHAGVKNLGNVTYEEILGYGTPGISAFAGMRFSI